MPTIADTFVTNRGPANGAKVYGYKASRFGTPPVLNQAPPAGAADAGPVTTGTGYGGNGEFQLTVPTAEPYYVRIVYDGWNIWQFFPMDASDTGGGGGGPATSPVSSVFGRIGAVVGQAGDYDYTMVSGAAPLASPAFTQVPTAPTAAPGTATGQLATTAFVAAAGSGSPSLSAPHTWTATQTLPLVDTGGQVYNAKGYGVMGDNLTDDTAAIQALFYTVQGTVTPATATGVPGGSIFFPPGEYVISSTITITRFNGVITGAGIGQSPFYTAQPGQSTVFRWTGNNSTPMFEVIDSWHIEWRDLRFEGNNTNPPTYAIQYQNNGGSHGADHYCSMQNCWMGQYIWSSQGNNQGNVATCIGYVGTNSNSDQWHFDRVIFSHPTAYGLYLPNTQSVWGTLKDCLFDTCGTAGIATNADMTGYNVTFAHCAIDLITGIVSAPTDLPNISIFGWYSENTGQMMNLSPDAHVMVHGGTVQQQTVIANNAALIAAYPSDKLSLTLDSIQFNNQPPAGNLTFTGTTGGTYTGTVPTVGAPILTFPGGIQTLTGTPVIATAAAGAFTVSGGSVTLAGTNLASALYATITFGPQSASYTGKTFIRVANCRGIAPNQLVFSGTMWSGGTNPSRCTVEWQSSDGSDYSTPGAKSVYAFRNELGPTGSGFGGWRQALNLAAWDMPISAIVTPAFKVQVTTNAGTIPVGAEVANFTNSSAAPMTITLATAGATDGQFMYVRIYDATNAIQGITWVNVGQGPGGGGGPANSSGSTTTPNVTGWQYDSSATLWRRMI